MQGKIAIVTGGAAGIGRASALALAGRGAAVVIADLDLAGAERTADIIRAVGGAALALQCDVSREDEVKSLIAAAVQRFGGLDILHNNAALVAKDESRRDGLVGEMEVALWDKVMAVNLRGPMLGCKFAIPEMVKRGGGAIVNTSSVASLTGQLAIAAYSASKAGLNALTRSVATQYGKQGIRCNAVAPGFIADTAATAQVSPDYIRISLDHVLTPYLGESRDIANMVAFLASEDARFITGQVIAVDGGVTAHAAAYADQLRAGVTKAHG